MPRTEAQIAAEKRRDKETFQVQVRFRKSEMRKLKKAAGNRPIPGWLRTLARQAAGISDG